MRPVPPPVKQALTIDGQAAHTGSVLSPCQLGAAWKIFTMPLFLLARALIRMLNLNLTGKETQ